MSQQKCNNPALLTKFSYLKAVTKNSDKIRIGNHSGIEDVRFRGIHFDSRIEFTVELRDAQSTALRDIVFGSYAIAAFRVSDQQILDTIGYSVSNCFGFAVMLLKNTDSDSDSYMLVGEPFQTDCGPQNK